MVREAAKIEARQYSELADLHLIPKMSLEYYFARKQRYSRMIDPAEPELPPRPGGPVLEAGSAEAHLAMRSVGQAMKGAMGYGRR